MNKGELRTNFDKYRRLIAHRMRNEGAIIEALPYKLNVTRIAAPRGLNTPENGTVEIDVSGYEDALALGDRFTELKPAPLARVIAWRQPGRRTTSFLPLARIPRRWRDDPRCTIEEVYPVLFQLTTPNTTSLEARVYLEWFAELRHELIVNIRVTIREHPVTWEDNGLLANSRWKWLDVPEADGERVVSMDGAARPPLVTLWWKQGMGHFPFALLGDGREVAHVK